jgi:hypothetical protein
MERMLAMLAPILQMALRPPSNPGVEIAQAYQGLGHILKRNAEENMLLYSDLTRKAAGLVDYVEGEAEEGVPPGPAKPSMLETAMPFIAEFAKMILGGGVKGAAAATAIQAVPQYKAVMKNPGELKTMISYLDKNYGIDKTNIMLKKLKVERPK